MPPDNAQPTHPPDDSRVFTPHRSISDAALQEVADGWEPRLDLCCPSPARISDFLLGGKQAFALEKTWCENQLRVMPSLRKVRRAERAFILSAVEVAVQEHGIDRFLVIGAGLPFVDAVHDVVLRHGTGQVVYVENDLYVLAYLTLLAEEHPEISCVA